MIGAGSGPPEPSGITSVAEFVDRLRRLRAWHGNPSLPQLARHSGIPTSTLHDALNRRRTTLPSLDLVIRVVRTLGGLPASVAGWEMAWRSVALQSGIPPKPVERQELPAARHLPAPRQLPAVGYGFVGRLAELKRLNEIADEHPGAVTIISGAPGVGKTALAVHWAHEIAERFPDGQLYLDLRGFSAGAPITHSQALTALIGALNVPGEQIPSEVDTQASLYRSLLAERRMLVVLDNAIDAGQVRPLLPGSRTCLTLITSRHALGGLVAREGARRLMLGKLAEDESWRLLRALLGADRVDGELEAAAELGRLCGHLPLALRIVVANLIDRPYQTLSGYAESLRNSNRLNALTVVGDEDGAVRAAFQASYALLDPDAQELFRRLGAAPWHTITAQSASALITASDAARLLETLAAAHLLEMASPGRYAIHDLLRLFAAQFGEIADEFALWYLQSAINACELVRPGRPGMPAPAQALPRCKPLAFVDVESALSWLDAERANLITLSMHGPAPYSWLLVDVLTGYLALRAPIADWVEAATSALTTATADDDTRAQSAMHASLGLALWGRDVSAATVHFETALALGRLTDDTRWQARMLRSIGMLQRDHGNLDLALGLLTEALAAFSTLEDEPMVAGTRVSLGVLRRNMGDLQQAATDMRVALDWFTTKGDLSRVGNTSASLSLVCRDLGQLDEAAEHATRALHMHRRVGDPSGEAHSLQHLASIQVRQGNMAEAMQNAIAAHELGMQLDEPRVRCDSLIALGEAREDSGRADLVNALILAQQEGYRSGEVRALIALSHVDTFPLAIDHATRALALASGSGYATLESAAQLALATAYHLSGEQAPALEVAEQLVTRGRWHGAHKADELLVQIRQTVV